MQHAVQHQKYGQGGIAVDKEDCQDGMNQPFPGYSCDAQGDDCDITANIGERAACRICAGEPCLDPIQAVTDYRCHQQPESDLELERSQQAEAQAEENGGIRKHIRTDAKTREQQSKRVEQSLAHPLARDKDDALLVAINAARRQYWHCLLTVSFTGLLLIWTFVNDHASSPSPLLFLLLLYHIHTIIHSSQRNITGKGLNVTNLSQVGHYGGPGGPCRMRARIASRGQAFQLPQRSGRIFSTHQVTPTCW